MNFIRLLRQQAGVTQQVLATRAGTSQPTIALYESGSKSPTLATLKRLASSLGLDLVVSFTPRLSREDRRSLAYHRAIAKIVRQKPNFAKDRAKRNLARMSRQHPGARELFERWQRWLDLPTEKLISRFLDSELTARDMRQVSPFAGLLQAGERTRILRQFRKEND